MPKNDSVIKSILSVTIDLDTAIWLRELSRSTDTPVPELVRRMIQAAKKGVAFQSGNEV